MKKPLKDYSPTELLEFLEQNESIDMLRLGAICSEILRRQNIYGHILWKEYKDGCASLEHPIHT